MKRTLLTLVLACCALLSATAQMDRKVQNKPYIDLRQLHFGILVGMNLQDA